MKPLLSILTNVKINRIKGNHSITSQEIGDSGDNPNVPLSHPLRLATRAVLFVLFTTALASSQTTLVAVRDSHSVVLAADSKHSSGDLRFCKIRRCGDAFLAVSGTTDAIAENTHTRLTVWPILADACKGHVDPRQRVTMLEQAGITWLNSLISLAKQELSPTDLAKTRKDIVISFFLVGWKRNGFIYSRGIGNEHNSTTGYTGAVIGSRQDSDSPLEENQIAHSFLGHFEGIQRFAGTPEPFRSLGLIKGAEFLVNSMILDKPTDVGAPVDILLIDKTGTHWVQCKRECEETKKNTPQAARRSKSQSAKKRR